MVKRVWEGPITGWSPVERWNNKLWALHKYLCGWARHVVGILKARSVRLSVIIDELEALAEVRPLHMHEIELKS
jgi:hypothetical protein